MLTDPRYFVMPALVVGIWGAASTLGACHDDFEGRSHASSAQTIADASSSPDAWTLYGPDGGLTGQCAARFGNALTPGFGRIDGVVYSIQRPADQHCAMPNRNHLIVQVLLNGAVYRLLINVNSTRPGQDPKVRYASLKHPLIGPPFAQGWHQGISLDYVMSLDAHDDDFTPFPKDELVEKIAADLHVGDLISIYATSGAGRPESAHEIHRNAAGDEDDGAVVIDPMGADPKFLLFHFDQQVF